MAAVRRLPTTGAAMRASRLPIIALAAASLFVLPHAARAADERFAIRFGVALLEPTSDTNIMGMTNEFEQGYGPAFDFEWYFLPRLGLQGSVITGADVDVDRENDVGGGVTITPITVGLNGHLVRNDKLDWGVGVFAGSVVFGDFEYDDDNGSFSSEDDATLGARSFVDIAVGQSGRWGFGFAVDYLDMTYEDDAGATEIDVDPFVVRAMGVWRFGGK
jgi:hypothetical protein